MITFITHMRVRAENAPAFEALMAEMCDKVRENEPGVLYYSFAASAKNPDTYVVIEVYRDASAHAAHMETPGSPPRSRRAFRWSRTKVRHQAVRDPGNRAGAAPVRSCMKPHPARLNPAIYPHTLIFNRASRMSIRSGISATCALWSSIKRPDLAQFQSVGRIDSRCMDSPRAGGEAIHRLSG